MNGHPTEALGAYADGELTQDEARRVEAHLARCTECAREVAAIRSLGGAMRDIETSRPRGGDTWARVHRRITRPVGWVLLVAGVLLWTGLALASWFRETLTLEWLAATAVGVGIAMLAVGIAYEQYREWKDSPYKDIDR
jgi:anti-sigma factor RsiW